MRTYLDCLPCFIRQTLDAARMASLEPLIQESLLREVLLWASRMDFSSPPPAFARRIHRRLRELAGDSDVYAAVKKESTETALRLLPGMEALVQQSNDPFGTAVRLAIAGNVIDFGVGNAVRDQDIEASLRHSLETPLQGCYEEFMQAVSRARNILYLADNAGEIVFDRLLLEQLGPARVTVAVRGAPILNDATLQDAQAAGLDSMVSLIENGSDAPGTLLDECGEEFKRRFSAADMIIAKGQGNFETLTGTAGTIFFLFKVKCPVVASQTGFPVGTNLVLASVH